MPSLFGGVLLALAAVVGAGSADARPTLYEWGAYPQALAIHLREAGGEAARQASLLEQQLQRTVATGRAVPPGLHAHLALLHAQLGNDARAAEHLRAEKALYPESARYMDYLLANARRPTGTAAAEAPK
jgi:hypothetical protein